jgi:hypothetical protein
MKKSILKLLMLFVATGMVFTSCELEGETIIVDPLTNAEVVASVEADDVSNEVNNLLDDYFASEDLVAKTASKGINSLSCMTKTVKINLETQTVTLDFGEGCTLPSGNSISGKIVMTYALDISAQSLTIDYTFDNFYFNDLKVTGTNKIVRIRNNENQHPQSTLTVETKVTWPNGDFAVRTGTKVREFVEGYETLDFEDNVFLITGNWITTFSNEAVVSAEITNPLRREMTCKHFVSGKVKFKKSGRYGVLDFGAGNCDNLAIFTLDNGQEFQIVL